MFRFDLPALALWQGQQIQGVPFYSMEYILLYPSVHLLAVPLKAGNFTGLALPLCQSIGLGLGFLGEGLSYFRLCHVLSVALLHIDLYPLALFACDDSRSAVPPLSMSPVSETTHCQVLI